VLVQFVNAKGNLLVALSSETTVSSSIVTLLAELDIALPTERTGLVVDHFNYDANSASEKHDVLVLAPPAQIRPGLKTYFSPEGSTADVIAFPHGVGHILGGSPLLTPILRSPRTAYSYNVKDQADAVDPADLFAAGEQLALVSAVQAHNSARVVVLGSIEAFSNKWFDAKVKRTGGKESKTWNREFAKRISGWAFHEIGVLRVNSIEHFLNEPGVANETNPEIYRVKNIVVSLGFIHPGRFAIPQSTYHFQTYSISLSEYSWDKWIAFTVPADDEAQLEFSMLSPFHRLKLAVSGSAPDANILSTTFTLPDQHGIFNFKVNYKRPFLTNVEEKNTVSVRHIAHDEWPRSYVISGAWPWITGIFTTVTGFVAFCAVWMYSAPVGVPSIKKTQ
jgi:oligosaccharyltransferase complex subunit beta